MIADCMSLEDVQRGGDDSKEYASLQPYFYTLDMHRISSNIVSIRKMM